MARTEALRGGRIRQTLLTVLGAIWALLWT
jgi:hypothetical protein